MSITIFHIIKMLGLKIHENPQFVAQPNMIAAFPGMENIVGIGFLTKNLNAKLFAEIYSYWPPCVTYSNGIINYSQTRLSSIQ